MTDEQKEQGKRQVAAAAVEWLQERGGTEVLGVGSGSTVARFIEALADCKALQRTLKAVVPASEASAQLLRRCGLEVLEPGQVSSLAIYVDGADEVDPLRRTLKGGGGALVREKLLASAADCFVCLCDSSKQVSKLGAFPLPVEVLPVALTRVAAQLARWGEPVLREGYVTDNGNCILDIRGARLTEPLEAMEQQIASLPGVLDCGIFARRRADFLLLSSADGAPVQLLSGEISG